MQDDLEQRVAEHLQRALCTYVEGDDTRATELTGEELRDIARAIIPIVLEHAAKAADGHRERWMNANGFEGHAAAGRIIAAAIRAIGTP
jgi:hypothetical protein